jgi:hypothetical protein
VQPTKKGHFVWLDAKTNQPLKSVTKWVCADTGAEFARATRGLSAREFYSTRLGGLQERC